MKLRNLQKRIEKQRERRGARARARIFGTRERPRMSVFRSARHLSLQLIDDLNGQTLLAADDREVLASGGKLERAQAVGRLAAERARARGITKVVFDRGQYLYHGRVKAAASGAREGGLEF